MPLAAERALSLSMSISLWEKPLGLAGVWGGLVRQWLDDLLPEDAAEQCRERVQLYVNLVEFQAIKERNSKCTSHPPTHPPTHPQTTHPPNPFHTHLSTATHPQTTNQPTNKSNHPPIHPPKQVFRFAAPASLPLKADTTS